MLAGGAEPARETFKENQSHVSITGKFPDAESQRAVKIMVIGVGGAGGNIVNSLAAMIGSNDSVKIMAVNTDSQALSGLEYVPMKLDIGGSITNGWGAGSDPNLGKRAAEASKEDIKEILSEPNLGMVIIVAGMGNGTGTGAAPVIASIARDELGILTVGIVTRPFWLEGLSKKRTAEEGVKNMSQHVDTLIVIDNQKVVDYYAKSQGKQLPSLKKAFLLVDQVVIKTVRGLTDIIVTRGHINVDFADVEHTLRGAGEGYVGIGYARGDEENRIENVVSRAVHSPLLGLDLNTKKPKRVLVNIKLRSEEDVDITEFQQLIEMTREFLNMTEPDDDENLKFGIVEDSEMNKGDIELTIVAAGWVPLPKGRSRRSSLRRGSKLGRPSKSPRLPGKSRDSSGPEYPDL